MEAFCQKLSELYDEWKSSGVPSREKIMAKADALVQWKSQTGATGLWSEPPCMLTATLDDGLGQGIEIINFYAEVIGFQVIFLGLMQPPEAIIDACRRENPVILGLTVLQVDSEDALAYIGRSLPPKTMLMAGGAAFQYDGGLAARCGVAYVAKNVADFVNYVLEQRQQLCSS